MRHALLLVGLAACSSSAPAESRPPSSAEAAPAPTPPEAPGAVVDEAHAPEPTSPPAHAAFTPSTAEQRGVLRSALRRGRIAARAGDHAAALAIYREGLVLEPDDPHLLCEAGWSAFQVGDAEAADRYLAVRTTLDFEPNARAACLYNLGRLHETNAERDGEHRDRELRVAARAYAASLELRLGNAVTRTRYEALPASVRSTVCPPPGPYDGEPALCSALVGWDPLLYDPECAIGELPLPVDGVDVRLRSYVVSDGGWNTVFLVEEAPSGLVPLAILGHFWDRSCSWGSVEVERVRSEAGRLEVTVHETGQYDCASSDYDVCLETHVDDFEACEGLDETPEPPTDVRHRFFCDGTPGARRCSLLGPELYTYRAWAELGPVPEGDALEQALECPAR